MVDAAVSKTVGMQLPCRFESDLRHKKRKTMQTWQEPKTRLVGKFLGIPYDFRFPWLRVVRERFWNHEDIRVFTPMSWAGVGQLTFIA